MAKDDKNIIRAKLKNLDLQKARIKNKIFIMEYLTENHCVDCGEDDIIVLDFDHTEDNKTANVSFMAKNRTPITRLIEEISKCQVRCSNCHRKKTAIDQKGRPLTVRQAKSKKRKIEKEIKELIKLREKLK